MTEMSHKTFCFESVSDSLSFGWGLNCSLKWSNTSSLACLSHFRSNSSQLRQLNQNPVKPLESSQHTWPAFVWQPGFQASLQSFVAQQLVACLEEGWAVSPKCCEWWGWGPAMSEIFVTGGPCHMEQRVNMNKHRGGWGTGESWKSNHKTAKVTL